MSAGLLTQLRTYYDSVDENQSPIRPEEVSVLLESVREYPPSEVLIGDGRVRPLRPPPTMRGTLRRWVVAAAAAAVVLILVVPVVWLAGGTEPDVGASGPGAATIDPSSPLIDTEPVASSSVFDPVSSLTWSRVPHDAMAFGDEFKQWMSDVAAGGPGLVAVGHVAPEGDDEGHAAVWTSPDGIGWSRVPHNEALSGGTMNSVVAGGPGLVAVGDDHGVAAVWTSVDGIAWSRVPHDESVLGEPVLGVTMSSVTVGGPGLVAVGVVNSGQGTASNAVVWTSVDGITWSRVPHNDAIFGRKEVGRCCTGMSSVTAGGPGLVAVGLDWLGDGEGGRAAVWTSVDGIAWSRVPHHEALVGGWMSSVTAGGPGLVAVGHDTRQEGKSMPAVWTSVDGITWSRVPHSDAVFGVGEGFGGTGLDSVSAGGPGLVAVGSLFMRHDALPYNGWVTVSAVWTSPDGVEWARVPHDRSVFEAANRPELLINSVTASGPGLVAVGVSTVHDFWAAHNDSGESDAVVWIAVPGE